MFSFDTPPYAFEPVRAFHLGVLSLDEGPRHYAPLMLTRSWEALFRPSRGLLPQCRRLGQTGFPELLTSVLSCRPIVPQGGILPNFL